MKTLLANNYQQAYKELAAIDAAEAAKIPQHIKAADSRAVNFISVRRVNDMARERYINTIAYHRMHPLNFEKFAVKFKTLGYSQIIVLHDPKKVAPPVEVQDTPQAPAPAEPFNVNKARIAELIEYAEDHGIELAEDDRKPAIVKKIKAWQEENLTDNAN